MLVAVIERDNIIIPLNFEPIENVGIVYDKQDCEINAAKRMMKRIKQQLKRLPICISGDAPYFNEYYETTKKYGDIIIKEENEEIYEYYNNIHYRNIENMNMIKLKMKEKGFNDLTNHGYHMKHAYSYDENAIKGHYAIMLISHLIMQLLEMYERNHGRFETIRQLGEEIKEALRNKVLSAQDLRDLSTHHHLSRINLQLL